MLFVCEENILRQHSTNSTQQGCSKCHLFGLPDPVFNFVLIFPDREAVVEVQVPGSDQQEARLRKRTAGVLDMGGVSTQIAYEVPKTVSFASPQQVIIHNQFCFLCRLLFWSLTLSFSPLLPTCHPSHPLVKDVCTIFCPVEMISYDLHSPLAEAL